MTKEDKELLLKDLCARIPYGVKILDNAHKDYGDSKLINIGFYGSILIDNEMNDIQYYPIIDEIKPYLRPLSSMTVEEKKELNNVLEYQYYSVDSCMCEASDWLNKKMFDYRGLIEKGLAVAITEDNNPYKE